MEIKLDINRLIDRLCNAERTVGEQGDIIRDLEKRLSLLSEELSFEKQGARELITVKESLEEELKSERETASFWYNKALELGWEYKPLTNTEEGDFAHGA